MVHAIAVDEVGVQILEHWRSTDWLQHSVAVSPDVVVPTYPGERSPVGYRPQVYRVGPGGAFATPAQLFAWLMANPGMPLPTLWAVPDDGRDVNADMDTVVRLRVDALKTSVARLKETTPASGFVWHTSRYTSVLQHVAGACSKALTQLGHSSAVIMEPAGGLSSDYSLIDYMRTHRPGVAMAINYTRNNLYHPDLTHVCWIQDAMPALGTAESPAAMLPQDRVYACSATFAAMYTKLGYSRIGVLPFGYAHENFPYEYQPNPEPSVAFITNLPVALDPKQVVLNDLFRKHYRPLAGGWGKTVAGAIARLGNIPEDQRSCARYYLGGLRRYQDAIAWATRLAKAGIPYAVYGSGWEDTMHSDAWGGVISKEDLPGVYRKHLAVIGTQGLLLHPRLLECYSSGGICLQLVDELSSVERLPSFDKFCSPADLIKKIRHLQDPAVRRAASENVQPGLREHTWVARMEWLCKDLGISQEERRNVISNG